MKLEYFHISLPKKGTKFIALYADGSGAELFHALKDNLCINMEKASYNIDDLPEHGYNAWIALPDNFELWYEKL